MILSLRKLLLKLFHEDGLFYCSKLGNESSILNIVVELWLIKHEVSNYFSTYLDIYEWNMLTSPESIKTPSSVSFVLDLMEKSPKSDLVGVFELNQKWNISFEPGKKLIRFGLQFKDYCISIKSTSVRWGLIRIVLSHNPHIHKTYASNLC